MAAIKPIRYKVPNLVPDGSGGTIEEYALHPDGDFAEVSNLNERMEIVAQQQADGVLMQFKVRYRPSLEINKKWLIVYEGKDYKVTATPKVDERNFYYRITAKHIG